MDVDYNSVLEIFKKYVSDCRKEIQNNYYDEKDYNIVKQELLFTQQLLSTNVQDTIKLHKNKMIDIKYNHTMRIVNNIRQMSIKMNTKQEFTELVKLSALFHDIARFNQAIWSNNFHDRECLMFNGSSHAEYGYKILYINKRIVDFNIPRKYRYAICNAVRYHQIPILTGDLTLKINKISELDTNKFLTGSELLNKNEKIIIASLVQMVKDVDMLDIFYQHITGEYLIVKPLISFEVLNDSIDDISKYWNISKEEIMRYNKSFSNKINIPTNSIPINKLIVPIDIQERFFKNEDLDLKELQSRRDFTFIVGMWWRLNHFLNNINFTSNLELLEEKKVLESIYNRYPDKYKPLVEPAFLYAQKYLLEKKIKENKGKIYTK